MQPQPEKIEKKVEAVDSASPASIIAKIEKELTTNKKLTPQEKLKLRTKLQFNKKSKCLMRHIVDKCSRKRS